MTWLLHPVVVFSALWVGVIGLCALGLLLLWPAPPEPWSDERRRLAALAGLFVSDRGSRADAPSSRGRSRSGSSSGSRGPRPTAAAGGQLRDCIAAVLAPLIVPFPERDPRPGSAPHPGPVDSVQPTPPEPASRPPRVGEQPTPVGLDRAS